MRRLAFCLLIAAMLNADELDILDSFDAIEDSTAIKSAESKDGFLEQNGYVAFQSVYNTDKKREFKRARIKGELELRKRFFNSWRIAVSATGYYDSIYSLNDRGEYKSETLKDFESEIELKEAYVQGSILPSLDIKIGRQIAAWGKSDNLRVTDMLNPLDMREPGMIDIEDLRLPTAMAKIDYYIGKWDISLFAIPEVRFSKLPPFGSDFYPFGDIKISDTDKPKGAQFAAALSGNFEGWDIAFYGANLYRDELLSHERFDMLGSAAAFAFGDWLIKSEAAYLSDLKNANEKFDRFDALIGAEYAGINDATFSIEAVLRDPTIDGEKTAYSYAARSTYKMLNERANINLLVMLYGKKADDGAVYRLWGEYDLKDSLKAKLGYALYDGKELPYSAFKQNDRIFAELKFSF
ncbi:MAG: hypothetical protein LBQ52_07755 [Helicobacteraceae bacterium]|nr:hypothetical protein [Helicobacteraceae bacterium]